MKCKDLKNVLNDIDDDTELSVSIFSVNKDGNVFLSVVNDTIHDRLILSFANEQDVIM